MVSPFFNPIIKRFHRHYTATSPIHHLLKTGLFALLLSIASLSQAMTFEILKFSDTERMMMEGIFNNKYPFIHAFGEITADTPEAFQQFMKEHRIERVNIILSSVGGNLNAGIKLGQDIREHNSNTLVAAECAGACVYAFAGGVQRHMLKDDSKLGFQQFSSEYDELDKKEIQQTNALLIAYLKNMGIDPSVLVYSGLTAPEEITWLTKKELREFNFITFKNDFNTTAELKLHSKTKRPYLKITADSGVLKPVMFILAVFDDAIVLETYVLLDEKEKDFKPTHYAISASYDSKTETEPLSGKGNCNDDECIGSNNLLRTTVFFPKTEMSKLLEAKHLIALFWDKRDFTKESIDQVSQALYKQPIDNLTDEQIEEVRFALEYTYGKMGCADISSPDIREKMRNLFDSSK